MVEKGECDMRNSLLTFLCVFIWGLGLLNTIECFAQDYDYLDHLTINRSSLLLHPDETYYDISVCAYYNDGEGNVDPNCDDVTVPLPWYDSCSWSSSNSNVARVNSYGYITGENAGNANITCTVYAGYGITKSISVAVTVATYDRLDHLTINKSTLILHPGDTYSSISVCAYYNDGHGTVDPYCDDVTLPLSGYDSCSWSSSNANVATVSTSGFISAVNAGSANVTCTVSAGYGITKSISTAVIVAVYDHLDHLTINNSSITIHPEETYSGISVCAYYNDGHGSVDTNCDDVTVPLVGYDSCSWGSSNTNVVKVSSSGLITGVNSGSANVTCTVNAGYSITKSISVAVTVAAYDHLDHLTINTSSIEIDAGETYSGISVCAYYNDGHGNIDPNCDDVTVPLAGYDSCSWASSNANIATVGTTGLITGVSTGNANVTCTVNAGYGISKSIGVAVTVTVTIQPASPEGLAYSLSGASVILSWNPVTQDVDGNTLSGIVSYNIYKAVTNVGSPIAIGYPSSPYTDNTGTPGSTYKYQVAAMVGGVEGPKSDFITVMVPLGDVPAPEWIELRQDGDDVEVTWSAVNVANVLEYCLERTTVSNGDMVSLPCQPAGERYYRDATVPTADPGQTFTYTYSVWARVYMVWTSKDGAKKSKNIDYIGEAPDLPPAQVRNFRYYAGADYVTLKWEASNPAEDVVGYKITRNGWSADAYVTGRLSTSYPDRGLSPGSFTYTIVALDDPEKDGVPPYREGAPFSITVEFVGTAIIKTFTVTQEIDPTNCSGTDFYTPGDLPPVATIAFTLNEPSDITVTILSMDGQEYTPIHLNAVPRNVSAELYWPPDRCDSASLSNPVLPGDYEITLYAWSIVPQASGRVAGRVLSRDVSAANDSKKRITKVIKTKSYMVSVTPNYDSCQPDGMPNKNIAPAQALAEFSVCNKFFSFAYFMRGVLRTGTNCCDTPVNIDAETFKNNLVAKNLGNIDKVNSIDNLGSFTSTCNGISAQTLKSFTLPVFGNISFMIDGFNSSRDATNQYQINNVNGVVLLHGSDVYHISSIGIQQDTKDKHYYVVFEFAENISLTLKALLNTGNSKTFGNRIFGLQTECKTPEERFP